VKTSLMGITNLIILAPVLLVNKHLFLKILMEPSDVLPSARLRVSTEFVPRYHEFLGKGTRKR
jgi:hypothetical protein